MVETEKKQDLKGDLLRVAYLELRERSPNVTSNTLRNQFYSCWVKWRNADLQRQAEQTAANVPHDKLVQLWPTVLDMLWETGNHWEDPDEEIEGDELAEICAYGLACLRYENRVHKGLQDEPEVSFDEAAVWLEEQAWLVNVSNHAQPGLPF